MSLCFLIQQIIPKKLTFQRFRPSFQPNKMNFHNMKFIKSSGEIHSKGLPKKYRRIRLTRI